MPHHRRNAGLFPLKPLKGPSSTTLQRCYAREGRNWHVSPDANTPDLLLLVEPRTRAWLGARIPVDPRPVVLRRAAGALACSGLAAGRWLAAVRGA